MAGAGALKSSRIPQKSKKNRVLGAPLNIYQSSGTAGLSSITALPPHLISLPKNISSAPCGGPSRCQSKQTSHCAPWVCFGPQKEEGKRVRACVQQGGRPGTVGVTSGLRGNDSDTQKPWRRSEESGAIGGRLSPGVALLREAVF